MSDKYATMALQLATLVQLKHLSLKSKHSTKKYSTIGSNVTMDNYKAKFFAVYEILKAEILADPAAHYTDQSREWVEMMLEHNVPHGKLNRGLAVIDSYMLLKGEMVTDDEFFLASVLGWAIEWLQACFLVLDDIMDESQTRRGQPCWFRLPMVMDCLKMYSDDATGTQVGNIAVNDGVLLHSHIGRILKRHFHTKSFCTDLLDLFNEVGFQTACGQMLDLITTYDRDLEKCKLPIYTRIVEYKTAYYSFYLPVACALLMAGENLDNHVSAKKILVKMGVYFQVQDDYLDCFGDPEVIGKIGTDIEDFKCSWLLVKALEKADESQRQRLHANYGKKDPSCIADVKALFNDLKLEEDFLEYENGSYNELVASIEDEKSTPVQLMLKSFLKKIYKRQK